MVQSGLTDEAIQHLQEAIDIDPTYVPAYSTLGYVLLQKGRPAESLNYLETALRIDPDFVSAHFNIANTLLQLGRAEEALSHLQKALASDPNDAEAQKNMAWILATCPDSRIRNGAKAVQLAEHANELTKNQNPIMVITLAAAYAEVGRFPEALKAAEHGLYLAEDAGSVSLAATIREHISLYRAKQPVRDIR